MKERGRERDALSLTPLTHFEANKKTMICLQYLKNDRWRDVEGDREGEKAYHDNEDFKS